MITTNAHLSLDPFIYFIAKMEGISAVVHTPLEQQFSCGEGMKKFFHNHFEKFPNEKSFTLDKRHISFELIKKLMHHAMDIWNVLKKQTKETNPCLRDVLSYALSLEDRLKNYLYKIDQVIQGFLINKMVTPEVVGNIKFTLRTGASFEKKVSGNFFNLRFTTNNIANFIEMYIESKLAKVGHLPILTPDDIERIKGEIKTIPKPSLFMEITFLRDLKENILVDSIKLQD